MAENAIRVPACRRAPGGIGDESGAADAAGKEGGMSPWMREYEDNEDAEDSIGEAHGERAGGSRSRQRYRPRTAAEVTAAATASRLR